MYIYSKILSSAGNQKRLNRKVDMEYGGRTRGEEHMHVMCYDIIKYLQSSF